MECWVFLFLLQCISKVLPGHLHLFSTESPAPQRISSEAKVQATVEAIHTIGCCRADSIRRKIDSKTMESGEKANGASAGTAQIGTARDDSSNTSSNSEIRERLPLVVPHSTHVRRGLKLELSNFSGSRKTLYTWKNEFSAFASINDSSMLSTPLTRSGWLQWILVICWHPAFRGRN